MHRRVRVTTRVLAVLAVAAAGAAPIFGCSPGADYPSIFPAVHDMPPPRADTTLDPVQVQQATEDLITARDHLNAEAPASSQEKAAEKPTAPNAATAKNASKSSPQKKPAAAGNAAAAARSSQTAGADTKP